jgi:hypothetical protein
VLKWGSQHSAIRHIILCLRLHALRQPLVLPSLHLFAHRTFCSIRSASSSNELCSCTTSHHPPRGDTSYPHIYCLSRNPTFQQYTDILVYSAHCTCTYAPPSCLNCQGHHGLRPFLQREIGSTLDSTRGLYNWFHVVCTISLSQIQQHRLLLPLNRGNYICRKQSSNSGACPWWGYVAGTLV